MTLESDIQAFKNYTNEEHHSLPTIFGALIYRLAEGSSGGTTPTPVNPSITIATSDGSITAGAKFASFALSADAVGTIQGTAVDGSEIEGIEFPYISAGYTVINYTISAGSFTIVSGV